MKNPSLKAIQQYYRTYYVPSNMALVMSGDFDPDSVIQVIDAQFSSLVNLPRPKEMVWPQLDVKPFESAEVFGPNPPYVMIGYPMTTGKELATAHVELINSLLYNGKAGLMDVNLNLAQKVQGASSFTYALNDAGSAYFYWCAS